MPFDPKLIHPDEPPLNAVGELDLSADLAALAEQLGDDSAHLARCYPADGIVQTLGGCGSRSEPRLVATSKRGRSWLVPAAIVVVTSLAAIAVIGLSLALGGWLNNAANPVVQTPRDVSIPTVPQPVVAPAIPSPTTLSLGELSGPELEALLDLWHSGEAKSSASISF